MKYKYRVAPLLLSLAVFFYTSSAAFAAITYVQGVQAGANPGSVTFPSPNATGSLIIVYLNNNGGAGTIPAPTDTAGNTYVDSGLGDVLYNGSGNSTRLYYVASSKAKTGNIVSNTAVAIGAYEFSGVATTSPIEVTTSSGNNATTGSGPNNEIAGTLTTVNVDLIVGTFSAQTGPTKTSTGFISPFGSINGLFEYKIQTSTGAVTVTASDTTVGDSYAGVAIAFKPPAAGGGGSGAARRSRFVGWGIAR